jgi:thioredoxin reductase
MSSASNHCDVAIVGAGPSGLAAAEVLRDHDVHVTIIDEQARPGGQILRQPPRGFSVDHWLPGKLYDQVKRQLRAVDGREGIDWRLQSTVLGFDRPCGYRVTREGSAAHELWVQGPSGCYVLRANAVLLACGCYERPLAFPGWTLPGVMGAGAIQGFLKSQQLIPGSRFVLAGSHPLQLVVADQLSAAGADVDAVVFTQRMHRAAALLRHPMTVLRHSRQFFETAKILRNLRRRGVPLIFGSTILRAEGKDAVERVVLAALRQDGAIDPDRTQVIACDRVGICHGFLASSELVRQAGARVWWHEDAGGWIAEHDEWLESTIKNLFVAGEITGVAGADAALEKGRVAAAGILRALGRIDTQAATRLASPARRRLVWWERFAGLLQELSRPPRNLVLEIMQDESVLCRCESITRRQFQSRMVEHPHIVTANAAKLLTRVGMGLCQGRSCGDNAAQLLAGLRGVPVAHIGPLQAQAPVKPVPLGRLLQERCDECNERSQSV